MKFYQILAYCTYFHHFHVYLNGRLSNVFNSLDFIVFGYLISFPIVGLHISLRIKLMMHLNFRIYDTVALKIIKSVDKYRDAAKLEINVLQKLREKDPKGDK